MHHSPLVSVCIITYNHERYLSRAIDSVLRQEVDFEFEVIIGEDYSSDSTLQIAFSYQDQYQNRIKVAQSGKKKKLLIDGHQTGRFNFLNALQKCQGKYIALLDGDDYWLDSNKLQKQVDYLENHPDCSFSFHNVYLQVYDNQSTFKKTYLSDTFYNNKNLRHLLVQINYVPTSSVVFRNNVPEFFPEIFYKCMFGDWPLHILNLNYGNPGYLKETMSVYRFGSGIWTKKTKVDQMQPILKFYDWIYEIAPQDIRGLIPFALAKNNIKMAFECLKTLKLYNFCVHLTMGVYHWLFWCLKTRRLSY